MADEELRQEVAMKLHSIQCGCSDYVGVGDEDSQYEEMTDALMPLLAKVWEGGWLTGNYYGYWVEHGQNPEDIQDLAITANPYTLVTK